MLRNCLFATGIPKRNESVFIWANGGSDLFFAELLEGPKTLTDPKRTSVQPSMNGRSEFERMSKHPS